MNTLPSFYKFYARFHSRHVKLGLGNKYYARNVGHDDGED